MDRIDVHKQRAARLRGVLRTHGFELRNVQAQQALAAAHGVDWHGLLRAPHLAALPVKAAMGNVLAYLQRLGLTVSPDLIPLDVLLDPQPEVNEVAFLRRILPPAWRGLPIPPFRRAALDTHRQVFLEFDDGRSAPLGQGVLSKDDVTEVQRALGGMTEMRAGLNGSFAVMRGGDANYTVHASTDIQALGTRLRSARLLDGRPLILAGYEKAFLGPHLRDVARHMLSTGADVHSFEWSGCVTGGGEHPGPGLVGLNRVVSNHTTLHLSRLYPRPGVPLVVLAEALVLESPEITDAHARALLGLVQRGAHVIVSMQSSNVSVVRQLGYTTMLDGADWTVVDVRDFLLQAP